MEYGSIDREILVQATPEIVYEVISSPEHMREWWPDDVDLDPVPGATGFIRFGDNAEPGATVVPLTVVEADPPRRFSFRWVQEEGPAARPEDSLLVTFDLEPTRDGTLLRFTEAGFREKGWEAAVLEERYAEHAAAWDFFLPRLVAYVGTLVSTR